MSNKMLAKRLLAAGMSVAMSATLFATNAITTFAEEPEELSAPVEAALDDDAPEFDFPTPEFNHEEGEPETVWESDDGRYRVDVVEVTNSVDVYVSDMNSTDEDGNQTDEYQMVNKEDTEGQTLDYTDAVTIVTMGDATVYLEDENGDRVQVKTEDGEEVDLELPAGTTEGNLHEVQVVENEDGSLDVLGWWDAHSIIYGYFAEDGTFVEGNEGDEGVQAYFKMGKKDEYVVADTMYYFDKADGTRVYLSEEMYKAITTGDSDVYTAKKEYEYEGETYTEDELKEVDEIKKVESWSYTVAGDPESIDTENNEHFKGWVPGLGGYRYTDVEIDVFYDKMKVTGEPEFTLSGWKYPVYKYFKHNNEWYVAEGYHYSLNSNLKVDDEFDYEYYPSSVNTRYDKVHKVTPATDDQTETTVYYRIYDNENPDKPILELDEYAFEHLRARDVTLIDNKYAVRDKDGDYVLIDKDEYTFVTECELVTYVSTVNYYTVQDKYEKDPIEVEVTIGDQTYTLSVDFWQNDRIGAKSVELKDNGDGTVDVTVHFVYSQYRNGYWTVEPEFGEDSITRTVSANTFGQDGTARMTIKYTPAYNRTNVPLMPEEREEIVEEEVLQPIEFRVRAVLAAADLAEPEDVIAILDDYFTGYEPADLINWTFLRSEVNIGEPDVVISNNDQPAPPSRREDDYTPSSTSTEETPVFFTTLAAPAGQVLGEQRPLAADGAAVLGASRARGTADETTAPIARVLVMAAVAATALFLTRKREENN